MMNGIHYINGQWIKGIGESFSSSNPANGNVIWQGKHATQDEVNQAIDAARKAGEKWAVLPISKRIEVINRFAEQLKIKHKVIAETISKENGKPLWEANTEVSAMIDKVIISEKSYGERSGQRETFLQDKLSIVKHKPHGVCIVLGPYNFPAHLPHGHIIPALLAGNTVVFKPSELTPLVTEVLVHCWIDAGLPAGVLNVVQGGQDTGSYLTESSDINAVFFTGSYATGKKLRQLLADRPEVILALEMGGNNPLVVWDVNNINAAAYLTIQSAFITAGQRCICARRLIIPKGKPGDDFLTCLLNLTSKIKVGSFEDIPEPFMGPVISSDAADQILKKQQELLEQGASSILKCKRLNNSPALLSPGIIDVTAITTRKDEEIFGPLLQVIRVKDFDAAVIEANNTNYGLSAGLFSEKRSLFDLFYAKTNAGIINWNCQLTGASGHAPFGGIGHSGNHRPSAYYAADYCAYPVAGLESEILSVPENLTPGISLE